MARELTSIVPYLVYIPGNEDDPRYPKERINLLNIDYIQIFSKSEVVIHFASGKTKLLKDDRAKALIRRALVNEGMIFQECDR